MRIECAGEINIIRGVNDVIVPSEANKYPDLRLARRLKRAGWRTDQITHVQEEMKEEELVQTSVEVDIVTPPRFGDRLNDFIFYDGSDLGLIRAQAYAREAIRRVVGEGRYIHTRKVFDALTTSQPRVALVVGHGGETRGAWSLHDAHDSQEPEDIFVTSMSDLLSKLELTRRYGVFVADVYNPMGYIKKVTKDSPLFYVIGDPKARLGKVNRQISDPTTRRR
jgi:hypothetical protein